MPAKITPARAFPMVVGSGRTVAATNTATASVATFTPSADSSYEIGANVQIVSGSNFSFAVQVTYTDETNTARTASLWFNNIATNAQVITIANAAGNGPYTGIPLHIRAKASTAITVITQAAGTYTAVVYNVEGIIKRIA